MPFDHDRPSLEDDPRRHDAEAVVPGSTARDVDEVLTALQAFAAPAGPLLDIGCGSGRHLRALAAVGHPVVGIDLDPLMVAAAQAAGVPPDCTVQQADASALDLGRQRFAAALVLNRSLVCFHSHRQARGLFASVARHLLPGGLLLIDNCATPLWDQVRQGYFADGVSESGDEQLFFLPGENRFVWRRGDAVDVDCWTVRPDDRIFRLWSLGEIALGADGAGLEPCRLNADTPLFAFKSAKGQGL